LTGTDPTSSLEAQYGSSGTRSFESPIFGAQMHVDVPISNIQRVADVPISNVQRVDGVHDVFLTDYFDVADRPSSFARDTPASRMTAGTRTLDTAYTRISDVRTLVLIVMYVLLVLRQQRLLVSQRPCGDCDPAGTSVWP